MFYIAWWIKWPLLLRDNQNEIHRICLSIIVPIFVIGIAITTLSHRLGQSGQLTAEYLHEACRLPIFTCQSYFTVLFAIAAFVFPWSASNTQASPLTYIVFGSTLAIIPFFLFIVVTLIRCANPQEAIKAVTRFSTNWLVNAFAKDAYDKISKGPADEEREIIRIKQKSALDEKRENHLVKVQNAFAKAVETRSLQSIQAWLDCTTEPIHRVFDICKNIPEYKESTGYDQRQLYEIVEIYELALKQLLVLEKKANLWFVEKSRLRIDKAVHDEVYRLLDNQNYTCLRPLCWIVVQLYKQLLDSEYSNELRGKRAYFGSFYEFIPYRLKELPNDYPPETKSDFRQILHEGLSLWLRNAVENKDQELVESLCGAGRNLVFGDDTIDFKNDKAILQHIVLTGKLISDILDGKSGAVSAKSLRMLFPDRHATLQLNLSDLTTLYKDSRPTIANDLYRFIQELGDAWERTSYNPLIGSGWYSGTRYGGGSVHLETGFLYAAALTLESNPRPDSIPIDLTDTKRRLSELKNKSVELQRNGGNAIDIYFDSLGHWIDDCKKKKDEEDNKA